LSWAILQQHLIDGIAATVISRTVPKARNWRSFFGPHCGKILSQILKLFLGSVKQQPILSSCELYELQRGLLLTVGSTPLGEIFQPEMTPSQGGRRVNPIRHFCRTRTLLGAASSADCEALFESIGKSPPVRITSKSAELCLALQHRSEHHVQPVPCKPSMGILRGGDKRVPSIARLYPKS
jgi:hypothetical protein